MKRVDDFRLKLGGKNYVPIMIGGMGVDISTAELALEAARLGGIGHISDALVTDVSDRRFDTTFVKDKTKEFKHNILNADKSSIKFRLEDIADAQRRPAVAQLVKHNGEDDPEDPEDQGLRFIDKVHHPPVHARIVLAEGGA